MPAGGASDLALPVPPGPAGWQNCAFSPLAVRHCRWDVKIRRQPSKPKGREQAPCSLRRGRESFNLKGPSLHGTGIRSQDFPQGLGSMILLRNGPCQVRFRNSRFQELPRGVPWLEEVLARTLPYTGQYVPEKNSARTGMGPKNAPCLAPTTHATSDNSSTRSSRMKRGSGDRNAFFCCGQMYWDFTPSKILEHFGFQSTRQTAAKFKP